MLYLISTPIGNLEDISIRAIETLKTLDLLLCEDTRHSKTLLTKYELSVPLQSYHAFNESKQREPILSRLKQGEKIGLISDAGTPGICDPGEDLVRAAIDAKITVCPLPGPCAVIQALVGSGLPTTPFQFCGFLEKKQEAKKKQLAAASFYPGTTIFYESPKRLLKTLGELPPSTQAVVARELTKKFETYHRGTAEELVQEFKESDPRGECVLLIAGDPKKEWEQLPLADHIKQVIRDWGLDKKEAIRLVAQLRGLQKREVYQKTL